MENQDEFARRESHLIAIVEQELPDFARMCRDSGADLVLMHQDAFAASLDEDEYKILGMAIKFAGMHDKHVQVIPKNRTAIAV
jgi:hypothetical protein